MLSFRLPQKGRILAFVISDIACADISLFARESNENLINGGLIPRKEIITLKQMD